MSLEHVVVPESREMLNKEINHKIKTHNNGYMPAKGLSCPNSAGTLRSESETERKPEVPASPRGALTPTILISYFHLQILTNVVNCSTAIDQ